MKYSFTAAALAVLSTVSAHSWLECTNHDNSEILPWMKGNSTLNPPVIIDPGMPWYADECKGWPRNKKNPGNWIDDSSFYSWNIAANSFNGGASHPSDTHACPPDQRSPTYQDNAPMSTAAPGDMIRLRFGGNGHTRGYNVGGQPGPNSGTVSVYWKGKPESEITDVSEFTKENLLQTGGFSDGSFSYPADQSIKTPEAGLVDKGNWMELNIPKDMAPGRHMMVWVWTFSNAPQWSTCFDVMVSGSGSGSGSGSSSGSSSSAPASPAAPAPAASSPAAAPAASIIAPVAVAAAAAAPAEISQAPAAPAAPASPAADGPVMVTVTEVVDVYTTVWNDAPSYTPRVRRARQFLG